MTTESPRQLDPEGTRGAILDAAHAQFVEHGYAATSMAAIARDAGVTKSLIHHHFGSKRELWDAVKLRAVAGYGERQTTMLDEYEPGIALMEDSIVTYFRFLRDNPDVVRLVSWMAVEGDESCTDVLTGLTEHGLERIREGQKRGLLRDDIDARFLLAPFFTLVRGWFTELPLLRSCVGELDDEAHEAYLRAIVKIFAQGLEPRKGQA